MENRPPILKGIELFEHMLIFFQRAFGKKADKNNITEYLDINTCTPHQHSLMEIDYHLKIQGTLMDDLNEGVSLQKSAQVRLDNLGQIKSRSTFINDLKRLERLRARYELQRSLGRRDEIERLDDEESMEQEKAKLETKLPDAVNIFSNNETGKHAFTKECATSILLIIFGKPHSKSLANKEFRDNWCSIQTLNLIPPTERTLQLISRPQTLKPCWIIDEC